MKLIRKIVVAKTNQDVIVDYSNNYEIMKEFYKCIEEVDSVLAFKLHNASIGKREYKLFTHQIYCKNAKYGKESITYPKGSNIQLTISGQEKIVNSIILGMIERGLTIGNCKIPVIEINQDKFVKFNELGVYRVRTPIIIKDKNKKFLNPMDEDYFRILGENLKRKYKQFYNEDYVGELYFDIENLLKIEKTVIRNVKKGIIVGYSNFEIYIQATPKMQKIAYYCGLGSYNALGTGFLSHITSRRCE